MNRSYIFNVPLAKVRCKINITRHDGRRRPAAGGGEGTRRFRQRQEKSGCAKRHTSCSLFWPSGVGAPVAVRINLWRSRWILSSGRLTTHSSRRGSGAARRKESRKRKSDNFSVVCPITQSSASIWCCQDHLTHPRRGGTLLIENWLTPNTTMDDTKEGATLFYFHVM